MVPVADILNPAYVKKENAWIIAQFKHQVEYVPELGRRTERPTDQCLEVSTVPKTKLYSAYALVYI